MRAQLQAAQSALMKQEAESKLRVRSHFNACALVACISAPLFTPPHNLRLPLSSSTLHPPPQLQRDIEAMARVSGSGSGSARRDCNVWRCDVWPGAAQG
jgi:hypothetical protein